MAEIAVVDFACFNYFDGADLSEPNAEVERLAQEIYDAFTTIGFVFIKNHGIPEEEVSGLFKVAERFFTLPFEEKEKFGKDNRKAKCMDGWLPAGRQIVDPNDPNDFKEAYDVMEPYNDDIPWPTGSCSDFHKTVKNFYQKCDKLSHAILNLISYGLKLEDRSFFTRAHGKFGTPDNATSLRLLYYPFNKELKPGQVRLGQHTDYGTITLLFQDQVGGLEVFSRDEGFVPVRPIEGTVLVNIGDLLQRWTNDKLVSTRHRVVVPHDETLRSSSRQSAAFFAKPQNTTVIECLDGTGHYPPITSLDYLKQRLGDTYVY